MGSYFLSHGSHPTREAGMCAMEWTAYLAGERHTDQPVCVSPTLRDFCIRLNDALDDEKRQLLRPYLARCIGTAGDGRDQERGFMCADWLIRVYTPAWLELVPALRGDAEALRALPPILAVEGVKRSMDVLAQAQKNAAAAGAAAGAAAWDATRAAAWAAAGAAAWAAAWDATRDAAGAAAWDAAWDAARAATWAAAWAAARDAAGAAAWDAAWDAARDATWAAARAAARDATWDAAGAAAWAATRDATRDALAPTVSQLQDSLFVLLDRMLPTELIQVPVVSEWREVCRF